MRFDTARSVRALEPTGMPMTVIKEFVHPEGLNTRGRTVARLAARGVIPRGRTLLLVHSRQNGDYGDIHKY